MQQGWQALRTAWSAEALPGTAEAARQADRFVARIALLSGDERFAVVAEAGDANEAQRCAAAHQPDVILLDNHMPGVSGVDALPGIRQVAPAARVLMLTVSEAPQDHVQHILRKLNLSSRVQAAVFLAGRG